MVSTFRARGSVVARLPSMLDILRMCCNGGTPIGSGLVLAIVLLGCAPAPRNVSCSNDGQCQMAEERFKYCLQSRCVECVASSSCGEGGSCVSGNCVRQCTDGRACPAQHRCIDRTCAPQ
jgi:hypothetical protein